MTTRRTVVLALGASALASPFVSAAQPARMARIGFLGATSAKAYASRVEALRAGLRDLGYVEGKNIVIEFRWADGKYERLPELAAELVRLKVDVIVTHGTPGTFAAKKATTAIPIVMAISGDAVATGLVPSVARPGGNITGSTFFNPELAAKRLELMREAVPSVKRISVLLNPANQVNGPTLKAMQATAASLKLELQPVEVRGPEEFERAFSAIGAGRDDALAVVEDAMLISNARPLADLAARNRLPSIGFLDFVEAGGLMAYGVNLVEVFRRAAVFVDKILKGTRPADLPVERSTRFDFVINLKTAKMLGLTIPQLILLRADRVIE